MKLHSHALRWCARLLSVLSLGLVLLFVLGQRPSLHEFSAKEATLFLFFPVGVCVGLIIAWWRERVGGSIAVASMAAFYAVEYAISRSLPSGPWFLLLASPGILFLLARPAK